MKTDKYIPTEYYTKLPSLKKDTILVENPNNGYKIKIINVRNIGKGKNMIIAYEQAILDKSGVIVETTNPYIITSTDLLVYYDSSSKKYKLNKNKTKNYFSENNIKV